MTPAAETQNDRRAALEAARIWLVFSALTRRGAVRYTAAAAAILAGELSRAADQYTAGGEAAAVGVVEPAAWSKYLDRVWMAMVPAGGALAGDWIGGAPSEAVLLASARAWLTRNGGERVAGISETSRDVIERQIRTGVESRESVSEISARLRSARLSIVPARAETIAGTEVHAAANFGSYVAAVDSRAVEEKLWLATPDGRVRDAHIGASGQRRELNDAFSVGGESMMYPGDPAGSLAYTINCRCTLGYVRVERPRARARVA